MKPHRSGRQVALYFRMVGLSITNGMEAVRQIPMFRRKYFSTKTDVVDCSNEHAVGSSDNAHLIGVMGAKMESDDNCQIRSFMH
jgi:hypothetical protein